MKKKLVATLAKGLCMFVMVGMINAATINFNDFSNSSAFTFNGSAQASTIEWASTVSNFNFSNAENALGQPDNLMASFYDNNSATTETATYSGFGDGDNVNYDSTAFASLLDTTEALIAQADFISIEFNGTGGGLFETSDWSFSDGINNFSVSYVFNDPAAGSIIGVGNISTANYANFFGLQDYEQIYGHGGEWAYILFDINGFSYINPFSSNFSVTLSAVGGPNNIDSPEPDVMGRMGTNPVPVPGTILLLCSGLIGLIGFRKKFKV